MWFFTGSIRLEFTSAPRSASLIFNWTQAFRFALIIDSDCHFTIYYCNSDWIGFNYVSRYSESGMQTNSPVGPDWMGCTEYSENESRAKQKRNKKETERERERERQKDGTDHSVSQWNGIRQEKWGNWANDARSQITGPHSQFHQFQNNDHWNILHVFTFNAAPILIESRMNRLEKRPTPVQRIIIIIIIVIIIKKGTIICVNISKKMERELNWLANRTDWAVRKRQKKKKKKETEGKNTKISAACYFVSCGIRFASVWFDPSWRLRWW